MSLSDSSREHAPAAWTALHPGPFHALRAPPPLDDREREIIDRFHDLYYSKLDEGRGVHTIVLSWQGYEMFKCPLDLWIYQELIFSERPDLIIETGTYKGGSALYLACMCDLVGHGRVVTIDIDRTHAETRPLHPRITYLTGSSTADDIVEQVRNVAEGRPNRMVILDSDHISAHVLAELNIYAELVQPGGYLIVEDTNINGHPTYSKFGPGPWEAVDAFLAGNGEFRPDHGCERFLLTMNPRGYLRRSAGRAS